MKNDFQNVVYSETDTGELKIRNNSATNGIKNVFLICSHPVLFGIKCIPVVSTLAPEQEFTVPLNFRALLIGQINVRFLIRYELEGDEISAPCKYRLARLMVFLHSHLSFKMTPYVNLSSANLNRYIVNF